MSQEVSYCAIIGLTVLCSSDGSFAQPGANMGALFPILQLGSVKVDRIDVAV